MPLREEPDRLVFPVALAASVLAFSSSALTTVVATWAERGWSADWLAAPDFDFGILASVVIGLAAGGLVTLAGQRPAARLSAAFSAARRMAEGDLASRAPEGQDLAGILGRLLNAVAGSASRLLSSIRREQGQLNRQVSVLKAASTAAREKSTLTLARVEGATQAVSGFEGSIRSIADGVETLSAGAEETAAAVAEVDASLSQVLARSQGLHRSSGDGAKAAASLAEGAANMNATLYEIARKTADLAEASHRNEESVALVGESSRNAAREVARVGEGVALGGAVVKEMRSAVERIHAAAESVRSTVQRAEARSQEIGRVVSVIEEIARQTNLLALNASLLATRAGEHGRGFSAVAAEIRKLSERTWEGARGIQELIDGMRGEVEAARAAADEESRLVAIGVVTSSRTEEALDSIRTAARAAEDATSAIQAATAEQRASIVETAEAIAEVRRGFDALADEGKRNNREAEKIRELVTELNDLAGFVERTVHEQKGAAGQIAVAAARSLGLMREIQDAVSRQTADSQRLMGLLDDVGGAGGQALESAALVEDAAAALEGLAGSLEDEVGRFRAGRAPQELPLRS
jgi:methyl-accepting chemotaxis protein